MAEVPALEAPTVTAIYDALEADHRSEDRPYLGMSGFGTECDRALWYGWRKVHAPERFDGRRLRLFGTGHLEEARIIENLRAAGVYVDEVDPTTGRQWAVWNLGGHLRGHLDGQCEGVPEAPKKRHVLECKSHNDKSFRELLKEGVAASKPGHFAQMQFYMHHSGLDRALYISVNKNDDALYAERVRYDAALARRLVARAERVLRADVPPPKLHADPMTQAAYVCGWCPSRGVCHESAFARAHCRTCLHATPVIDGREDGAWRCERFGLDLTFAEQMRGCDFHLYIPALVPGAQIDVDEAGEQVTYRLDDGRVWIDAPVARGLTR